MSRKIIVTIIAIVLVVGVVGGCYALYHKNATPVSVNIGAGFESVTLQINNSTNTAAQGAINLSGFSPDNRTQFVDVTLTVDHPLLVDGVHGLFTVDVTDTANTLGAYLTTTVSTLSNSVVVDDITTDALGSGYDVALSATPVYVRVSFYLNNDGVTNFATIADTTATVTLSWEHVSGSIWAVDTDAYYLVGSIGGVNMWDITEANIKLTDDNSNGDLATKENVTLAAGDEIKIRKGDGTWIGFWTAGTSDFSNNAEQIHINTAGTYRLGVSSSSHGWIEIDPGD